MRNAEFGSKEGQNPSEYRSRRFVRSDVESTTDVVIDGREPWATRTLNALSTEDKIRQMFMLGASSDQTAEELDDMEKLLIRSGKIGGIIFMVGEAVKQVELTNRFQEASEIPLLIAQDAEWGLGMRLRDAPCFPRNMTLGAVYDDCVLVEVGEEMGQQCRRIGVHVNLAPVVDINSNPLNPVIAERSFGENVENVAKKGALIMEGLQAGGVIACAKHFPGHGDTSVDSHLELPVLYHDMERLEQVEMFPFETLIAAGVDGVMAAHLHVPVIDVAPNLPVSLSPALQAQLRDKLGFDGLIITDSLFMQGVTNHFPPPEAARLAFLAGADVLLYCRAASNAEDESKFLEASVALILAEVEKGTVSLEELDQRVLRILDAKQRVRLHHDRLVDPLPSASALFSSTFHDLKRRLFQQAVTLVMDDFSLIPVPHALESPDFLYPPSLEPDTELEPCPAPANPVLIIHARPSKPGPNRHQTGRPAGGQTDTKPAAQPDQSEADVAGPDPTGSLRRRHRPDPDPDLGSDLTEPFYTLLAHSGGPSNPFKAPPRRLTEPPETLDPAVAECSLLLVALHTGLERVRPGYPVSDGLADVLDRLLPLLDLASQLNKAIVVVLFGTPYLLPLLNLGALPCPVAVLCAYEDDPVAQLAAANVVLGSMEPVGVLPVTPVDLNDIAD